LSKKKQKKAENETIQPVPPVPGFSSQFKDDLAWWFKTDSKKVSKILDIITEIMREPFTGVGKPEPLKYMDSDIWSRRINLEHRLIYRVTNSQIDFLSCRFHYH
jgi:toxin YoeB